MFDLYINEGNGLGWRFIREVKSREFTEGYISCFVTDKYNNVEHIFKSEHHWLFSTDKGLVAFEIRLR